MPPVTTDSTNTLCDYRGCHVTVMGLGRFGGGVGAVRFFTERGAAVTVTDVLPKDDLEDALMQIDVAALRDLHLGEHCEEDFRDADLIVVNPAVRADNPYLNIAREECIPLTSEMNLFSVKLVRLIEPRTTSSIVSMLLSGSPGSTAPTSRRRIGIRSEGFPLARTATLIARHVGLLCELNGR